MKDLAICVNNSSSHPNTLETIDAINNAGFKKVFVQWYDEPFPVSQQEQVNYCKKLGLQIIFAHLGYQHINSIWEEGEEGDHLVKRYCRNIDECAANEIPLVMMHLSSKFTAPGPNEIGLERVRKIVEYGKEKGVKVSFENTKIRGYQDYIAERLPDAGFCYDAGHVHAHFDDEFDFELFSNRIDCIHLHDNMGKKDEHLLPFDGTIDWEYVLKKLKETGYDRELTLETLYHHPYEERMTIDEFYRECYRRGEKLAELWEKL